MTHSIQTAIAGLFSAAFLLPASQMAWAGNRMAQEMPSDTAWSDHFDEGSAGAHPSKWLDDTATTVLVYSSASSYAIVSRTAAATDDVDAVTSRPILCNVDEYGWIEIRVSNVSANSGWELYLLENGQSYCLTKQSTGASGTFTFPYAQQLGWSGSKYFSIQLLFHGVAGSGMNLDYVCLFRNQLSADYLWREDFEGPAGGQVGVWFDAANNSQNAFIAYAADSLQATITLATDTPSEGPWGKVLSPAIYCDVDRYHWLEIRVTALDIGTRWKVMLLENGTWQQVLLGKKTGSTDFGVTTTGTYTFDFQESADWTWSGTKFFSVAIVIEGSAGKTMNVDYVKVLGEPLATLTPTPQPHTVPDAVFAAPNPFQPARNQQARFYFQHDSGAPFTVKILNLKGQRVRTLSSTDAWDGRNDNGQYCEGGLYIFQLDTGSRRMNGQVVLIK